MDHRLLNTCTQKKTTSVVCFNRLVLCTHVNEICIAKEVVWEANN